MILDWKMGLIGLSLGALSACSGADESANIAPTPDASAASEIQAPADVISKPEAIVTAAEDIASVVPADVSEAVAETVAETIAESTPSAADLTATTAAAAPQLKVDAAARVAAAAERAEAARIAAEQTAQTEARAATEAKAQASRQAVEAEAEAAERARAVKAAQDAEVAAAIPADGIMASGTWTKKKRTSKGTWSITREGGELFVKLDDDFSTRSAPDLKIFLSPLSAAETRSSNAIDDALLISLLSSNKGAQSYKIPSGTNLADYSSILIHCENYTVLWSAADL